MFFEDGSLDAVAKNFQFLVVAYLEIEPAWGRKYFLIVFASLSLVDVLAFLSLTISYSCSISLTAIAFSL